MEFIHKYIPIISIAPVVLFIFGYLVYLVVTHLDLEDIRQPIPIFVRFYTDQRGHICTQVANPESWHVDLWVTIRRPSTGKRVSDRMHIFDANNNSIEEWVSWGFEPGDVILIRWADSVRQGYYSDVVLTVPNYNEIKK